MPTLLWFFIAFVVAAILITLASKIIGNKKLKHNIQSLWDRRKPLENFIRPYHRYSYQYDSFKHQYDAHILLDDKTWSDLNMDAVFDKMNFNFTAIGEMRLYAALRRMFEVKDSKLIRHFKTDVSFRQQVSFHLAQIGKAIYPMFPNQLLYVKRNNFFMLCTYLPLIFLIATFFAPSVGIILTIFSLIFNMILSGSLKKTFDQDLNSMFYTSTVIKKAYDIHNLEQAPKLNVNFNHFKTARKFSGLLGRINSNDEAFVIAMLFKLMFMLDYQIFHLIQKSFKNYDEEVMACYEYVSSIDNHYSVALWRETLDNYTVPECTQADVLDFDELTHPLISEAISNDLKIKYPILLTGSNASGKSTFMKAVALNLVLAQTVDTVTASRFTYKPGLVYTSMVNQDDILSGDSYFMTEIKSIRRLFELHSQSKVYCFIDEIFKGTNTTERIAASESVLSYLDQLSGYHVIAATHDIELSSLLEKTYENFHFNESIADDNIVFDYKIKAGKANTRNAIELLRIMDFPHQIYNRAKSKVD